jgi:AraC family transcriptional regulator of arabinose operon
MPAQNYLHIWDDRLLYIAPSIASGMTVRSTATLLISLSGRPFTLRPLNAAPLRYRAALVAPHVARGLDADNCGLLSLNLDPVSVSYHTLRKVVGTGPIHEIDWRCFGNLRDLFEGVMHGQIQGPALHRFTSVLLSAICQGRPSDGIVDTRVKMVMQRLQCDSEKISLPDLAHIAGLSPCRLTHLFSQEVGLSIKRYLLWAKVRRAAQLLVSGKPLVDIAHASGFSDSSHMNRTYQQHFGLSPSFLADNAKVALIVDNSATAMWRDDAGSVRF